MHWYVQDVFDYQIKIFLTELLNLTTFEKLLKNNSKTTSPDIMIHAQIEMQMCILYCAPSLW